MPAKTILDFTCVVPSVSRFLWPSEHRSPGRANETRHRNVSSTEAEQILHTVGVFKRE
jgi:hypothetical protein